MIDIYSELDHSKVEQGWKPTRQTINERKPSDLCIGDWSLKCRNWFPHLRYNELTKFCESNGKKIKPSASYLLPTLISSTTSSNMSSQYSTHASITSS